MEQLGNIFYWVELFWVGNIYKTIYIVNTHTQGSHTAIAAAKGPLAHMLLHLRLSEMRDGKDESTNSHHNNPKSDPLGFIVPTEM